MSFNIQRINRDSYQIVSVSGYMGKDEFAKLESLLEQLLKERRRRVVLEFSELSFVTARSLVALVKYPKAFHDCHGEFKLSGLSAALMKLAKLEKLERKLDIEPDLSAAVNSLSLVNVRAFKRKKRLIAH